MEPNEHLEKYPEEVAITPQENPSRRSSIGKIVIIVCGISCASLVVFSWLAIKIYIRAHFMPFKIMIMNVRIVHWLLLYIS